jgi:transposase
MALVDANGLPIALELHPANRHEVTLCFDLVQGCWTDALPERVIGDKAYDSDSLDEQMANCDVEMIAAHRKSRTKAKTQDGRCLRRAKRRWKVERFFSWLQNFRRLVVRYERKSANLLGFVLLAATIMHVKYRF